MNYRELHEIIRHLKKAIQCVCKANFANEDMQVLSTCRDEGWLCMSCHKCKNQILVHVAMHRRRNKNDLDISIHSQSPITPDEVIDMHNFLKMFNGDFKNLFTT